MNTITDDEVKAIDSRIKGCIIENPERDDDEFYVKIWFNYQMDGITYTDGREEFVGFLKEPLLKKIKEFVITKKKNWKII